MIFNINFRKLRNSEFIQFFIDLFSILKKNNPEELGIKEQLDTVEKELELIRGIHGTIKGSDISDELSDLDDKRDDCIVGIRTVVEGYTYHFDAAIIKAAETLLNKIDSYGSSIARQNYPTETTSLKGIVESINNEEILKNAAFLLNINTWFAQMGKDNDLFNQRYLDKVDETSKQTDNKIKELRITTVEKYIELRNHLTSHATIKKTENYKIVIDQINVLIGNYNTIIKRRGSNHKKDNPSK